MDREELIRALKDSQATDLAVLAQAEQNAKARYLDASTKANLESWKAAQQAREDFEAQVGEQAEGARADRAASRRVFENANQVQAYLAEAGWKVSYNTVCAHVKKGFLKPRRAGGFTQKTVDAYAVTHLVKTVDASPAGDEPEEAKPGAAEERTLADAELKRITAERARLALARERMEIVPRELYVKDLAARMAFFSNQIDALAGTIADELIALVGGEAGSAARLLALLGADTSRAWELAGHFESLKPDIMDVFLRRKAAWLRAFAIEEHQIDDIEPFLTEVLRGGAVPA